MGRGMGRGMESEGTGRQRHEASRVSYSCRCKHERPSKRLVTVEGDNGWGERSSLEHA